MNDRSNENVYVLCGKTADLDSDYDTRKRVAHTFDAQDQEATTMVAHNPIVTTIYQPSHRLSYAIGTLLKISILHFFAVNFGAQ